MSQKETEPVPIPGASSVDRQSGEGDDGDFDKPPDSPWISPTRPGYSRSSSFGSLMGKSFDRYGEDFGEGAATLLGESDVCEARTLRMRRGLVDMDLADVPDVVETFFGQSPSKRIRVFCLPELTLRLALGPRRPTAQGSISQDPKSDPRTHP